MIGDTFVIDGVSHCLWIDPSGPPEGIEALFSGLHKMLHLGMGSRDPYWQLSAEQFNRTRSPEEFAYCIFAESQTDMTCYHGLGPGALHPFAAVPLEAAKAAQEIAPGRILLYAGMGSPLLDRQRAIDYIDQMIEEHGVIGLKFYPGFWDGERMVNFRMDDEKVAYPVIEHAQKRGLRSMAFHKAMGASLEGVGLGDMEHAATTFPEMNFEIVHGGMAFMEDTVVLSGLPNIYVTLEATSAYLFFAPRRFAEVIGSLCMGFFGLDGGGAEDRIIWSTAPSFVHPQPYLEKFQEFQIPEDMVDGLGYPQLTPEIKRKILGENFARLHGLNIEDLKAGIPNDEMRRRQLAGDLEKPWSRTPPVTVG